MTNESLIPRRRFVQSAAGTSALAMLTGMVPARARGSMGVLNHGQRLRLTMVNGTMVNQTELIWRLR